jgi:hypothetical protein
MRPRSLLSILFFALTALSAGQDLRSKGFTPSAVAPPTPPPYCSPCLFYGGDFDPTSPNANGLENDKVFLWNLMPNVVYVPFVVPSGEQWTVGGLFVNVLSAESSISPPAALYSISTGVSKGNGGMTVVSGTSSASYSPTGRSWNGLNEYTVKVKLRPIALQSGTYWLSVVPRCTDPNDSSCDTAAYFITDVEDNPPLNHKGIEPGNDSFISSGFLNEYFVPTWGTNGQCGGLGCNRFSAGVVGTVARQ